MMQTLYWRREYVKRTYYKRWVQPVLVANGTLGVDEFACDQSSNYAGANYAYQATSSITGGRWQSDNAVSLPQTLTYYIKNKVKTVGFAFNNKAISAGESAYMIKSYNVYGRNSDTDSWTLLYSGTNAQTTPQSSGSWNISIPTSHYHYYHLQVMSTQGNVSPCMLGYWGIVGDIESTAADYDYYEDAPGSEGDHTDYADTRVNAWEVYTHTTEIDILNTRSGRNIICGLRAFGVYGYTSPIGSTGGGDLPDDVIRYLPNLYTITAYADDGTKTAIFGAGSESNAIESLTFEVGETGCGACTITFRRMPTNSQLGYRQRVDISLFNDSRPWWSGYIITRPIEGTTDDSYKFTAHGYYNLLDKIIIKKTYENVEVSSIVADIARQVERKIGLSYNANKLINTAYNVDTITFDGVTAKEALKQLTDFAIDYVYGVDAQRQLYFMPRTNEINEQARFWVGKHIGKYQPTWDVEKIVNHAYVKGGNVDDEGEQWLSEVSDLASQDLYGIQEAVWSLPSAYSAEDAERWGLNQINKYKDPVKSAKVSDVILEYPRPDGSFFVRKLSTQGQAAVTDLDGVRRDYPITKLKYTVSDEKGISLDMELGEQPFAIDKYFANLDRDAKLAELLQSAATKQLKTGG